MRKVRFITLLLLILLFCMTLTGCLPANYTTDQKKAEIAAGKVLLVNYLKQTYNTKPSGSFEVQEGNAVIPENADYSYVVPRCLTHLVQTTFIMDDKEYTIAVNSETGEFYSNYNKECLADAFHSLLAPAAAAQGLSMDFFVAEYSAQQTVVSNNIPTKEGPTDITTTYTMSNLFPETITPDNASDFAKKILLDSESYAVLRLYYTGIPDSITKEAWAAVREQFPGLDQTVFYNVEKEAFTRYKTDGKPGSDLALHLTEEYWYSSNSFSHNTRKLYTDGDVRINYVARGTTWYLETDTQDDKIYDVEKSIQEGIITYNIDNHCRNYIFFEGKCPGKRSEIKLHYTFSDKPTKLKYSAISDNYYTIGVNKDKSAYFFSDNISFER